MFLVWLLPVDLHALLAIWNIAGDMLSVGDFFCPRRLSSFGICPVWECGALGELLSLNADVCSFFCFRSVWVIPEMRILSHFLLVDSTVIHILLLCIS
jgi:hypothetical protein